MDPEIHENAIKNINAPSDSKCLTTAQKTSRSSAYATRSISSIHSKGLFGRRSSCRPTSGTSDRIPSRQQEIVTRRNCKRWGQSATHEVPNVYESVAESQKRPLGNIICEDQRQLHQNVASQMKRVSRLLPKRRLRCRRSGEARQRRRDGGRGRRRRPLDNLSGTCGGQSSINSDKFRSFSSAVVSQAMEAQIPMHWVMQHFLSDEVVVGIRVWEIILDMLKRPPVSESDGIYYVYFEALKAYPSQSLVCDHAFQNECILRCLQQKFPRPVYRNSTLYELRIPIGAPFISPLPRSPHSRDISSLATEDTNFPSGDNAVPTVETTVRSSPEYPILQRSNSINVTLRSCIFLGRNHASVFPAETQTYIVFLPTLKLNLLPLYRVQYLSEFADADFSAGVRRVRQQDVNVDLELLMRGTLESGEEVFSYNISFPLARRRDITLRPVPVEVNPRGIPFVNNQYSVQYHRPSLNAFCECFVSYRSPARASVPFQRTLSGVLNGEPESNASRENLREGNSVSNRLEFIFASGAAIYRLRPSQRLPFVQLQSVLHFVFQRLTSVSCFEVTDNDGAAETGIIEINWLPDDN